MNVIGVLLSCLLLAIGAVLIAWSVRMPSRRANARLGYAGIGLLCVIAAVLVHHLWFGPNF